MLRTCLATLHHNHVSQQIYRTFFKWKALDYVDGPTYVLIPEVPVEDIHQFPLMNPRENPR